MTKMCKTTEVKEKDDGGRDPRFLVQECKRYRYKFHNSCPHFQGFPIKPKLRHGEGSRQKGLC